MFIDEQQLALNEQPVLLLPYLLTHGGLTRSVSLLVDFKVSTTSMLNLSESTKSIIFAIFMIIVFSARMLRTYVLRHTHAFKFSCEDSWLTGESSTRHHFILLSL